MKTGKSPKSSAAAGQMKLDSFLRPTTKAGDKTDSDCQIIFVSPKKSDTQMSTGKRFRNSPLKVGVSCQIEKRPKVLRSYAKSKKCSTEVADDISDSEVTASNEVEFNHAFMEESAKSGVSLPNVSDEELCSDAKTPGNSRTPSAEVTDLNDSFCTLDIGELDRLVEEQLNEVEDKNDQQICISQLPCKRLTVRSCDKSIHKVTIRAFDNSDSQSNEGNVEYKVILKGFWTNTRLTEGAVINIFGKFNSSNICTVTDNQNFIIVYPDVLVTGTAVSSGVYCARKTILSERIRGGETGGNLAMLLGSLVHRLFQEASQQGIYDSGWMESRTTAMLKELDIQNQIYACNIPEKQLKESMSAYIPHVSQWIKTHLSHRVPVIPKGSDNESFEVVGIHDIEENIWSPRYGIRGKIDLTLKMRQIQQVKFPTQDLLMPLELKTGKSTFGADHKAQVMLYNLMISHIHKKIPPGGLLLYLKDGSLDMVKNSYQSVRGVLQLRNELAFYLKNVVTYEKESFEPFLLPSPVENSRICRNCPQLLTCGLFYKNFGSEEPMEDSTYAKELIPQVTAHLSQSHLQFFAKWIRWICIEFDATQQRASPISDIWLKTAAEKERNGYAICDMKVGSESESGTVTFTKRNQSSKIPASCFSPGDIMVISNESSNHIALGMGQIVSIDETEVKISIDSQLVHKFTDIFRLDKYQSMAIMSICLSNIVRLMEDHSVAKHLRQIIIEREVSVEEYEELSSNIFEKRELIMRSLNEPQRTAIFRALTSPSRYLCIEGFPGTGKSGTIVALVRLLCALGKSVLLTSYTHSAVDNILIKLKKLQTVDMSILRVGSSSQIHPDCKCFTVESVYNDCESDTVLSELYKKSNVVAGTCLGLAGATATVGRIFDFCIVDEASMLTLPATIGPLLGAKKFVLVGDQRQLSPLVMSKLPKSEGMDDSLFSRLTINKDSCCFLNLQYRMNSEIMSLSNALWYEGLLACGTEDIANATCANGCPRINQLSNLCLSAKAHQSIISEKLLDSVIFLNTAELSDYVAVCDGPGLWYNPGESRAVADVCRLLISMGLKPEEIGVIGFYRHQCTTVRNFIRNTFESDITNLIEVNTADQYQGRDKRAIIITFVWTDETERHELLRDPRRLNVALTRAKEKLIMIGNAKVLRRFPPVASMLDIIKPHQIIPISNDL